MRRRSRREVPLIAEVAHSVEDKELGRKASPRGRHLGGDDRAPGRDRRLRIRERASPRVRAGFGQIDRAEAVLRVFYECESTEPKTLA